MIVRVIKYVAADRALALACIEDLQANTTEETPQWRAANKRVTDSEKNMPTSLAWVADRIAERWNWHWWQKVTDLTEEMNQYGETYG